MYTCVYVSAFSYEYVPEDDVLSYLFTKQIKERQGLPETCKKFTSMKSAPRVFVCKCEITMLLDAYCSDATLTYKVIKGSGKMYYNNWSQ